MPTIRYYAADETMGDTPEAQCALYRTWAQHQLEAAYPNYEIEVSAEPSLQTCWTDDSDHEDEIRDFCAALWDDCPWEWLND
jgi:hypothetical protein